MGAGAERGAMNWLIEGFSEFPPLTRAGLVVIAIGWAIAAAGMVREFFF